MANKPIATDLPADLPENWVNSQIVAPNGINVGLTQQHGYNYLMEQVNNAHEAINTINNAFTNLVDNSATIAISKGGTGATTAAQARTNLNVYSKAETDAAVASGSVTAGTGLAKTGTTINHSNSVIPQSTIAIRKLSHDGQGHITGYSGSYDVAETINKDAPTNAKLPTEKAVVDVLPRVSNTNLLDNWDFDQYYRVNQRGDSDYITADGTAIKTIDRWFISGPSGGRCQMSLNDHITCIASGYYMNIEQKLDFYIYAGQPFTLSVYCDDADQIAQLYFVTSQTETPIYYTREGNLATFTFLTQGSGYGGAAGIQVAQGAGCKIYAAKLERGEKQTLAEKTGGDWYLADGFQNPVSMLLKCQKYLFVANAGKVAYAPIGQGATYYSTANNQATIFINVPTPMKITPTVTTQGTLTLNYNGNIRNITSLELATRTNSSFNSAQYIIPVVATISSSYTINPDENVVLHDSGLGTGQVILSAEDW